MRPARSFCVSLLSLFVLFPPASPLHAQKRPMTILDLMAVPSVGDPQISPDGTRLLYVKSEADWGENETVSHIFRVNSDGSGTIQLTYGKEGQSSPRW